jgi:hypothetical protein
LEELARLFQQEPATRALLQNAGVPAARVPPFGHATPLHFWSRRH